MGNCSRAVWCVQCTFSRRCSHSKPHPWAGAVLKLICQKHFRVYRAFPPALAYFSSPAQPRGYFLFYSKCPISLLFKSKSDLTLGLHLTKPAGGLDPPGRGCLLLRGSCRASLRRRPNRAPGGHWGACCLRMTARAPPSRTLDPYLPPNPNRAQVPSAPLPPPP